MSWRSSSLTSAAIVAIEVGKNRLEALGDVAETVEFFRYYARQMEDHDGFRHHARAALAGGGQRVGSCARTECGRSSLPSTFPWLWRGPVDRRPPRRQHRHPQAFQCRRARPGSSSPGCCAKPECLPGAFQVITGSGRKVGATLVNHADVAGITFTGSYDVGMGIYKGFAKDFPKPTVCEMGGKNPAIVTASADLDVAAEGVMRGAFGFSGQKCSANSRVYVERPVYDEFVDRLVERAEQIKVGNPLESGIFMGPVIDRSAVERFQKAVAEVKDSGGEVLAGGEVIADGDLARGNFVEPTVVTAPETSWVWETELFLPFVSVMPVDSLDEAITRANDTEFGLTAGLFARTRLRSRSSSTGSRPA